MIRFSTKPLVTLVAAAFVGLAPTIALADKHGHGGKGHGGRHAVEHDHESRQWQGVSSDRYFTEQHRQIVRDYYYNSYRQNDCPPGLAKKRNGCQPPGHAKRWAMGRPIPRGVMVYDLPPYVAQRIGYPPAGYRFVRVASDILMIAIGSGLVVDAIADLNDFR